MLSTPAVNHALLQDIVPAANHDLTARPTYHHKREPIEEDRNILFAALAVDRPVEQRTGWSITRFVRTARHYRTVQIRAGSQLLTAEDPAPDDLRDALARITGLDSAHQFDKSPRAEPI